MSANLKGIQKEYMQTDSFRMIIAAALKFRPEYQSFDSNKSESADIQIEKWKALSAERNGFDKAFKVITGINVEEFNNE